MDKMQENKHIDPSEQSSMKLSEDELLFMNEELDSLIQTELGSPQ